MSGSSTAGSSTAGYNNRSAKRETLGMVGGPGASGKFLAMSSRQLLNKAFQKFINKPKSGTGSESALIDDASLAGGSTCNSSAAMFPVNNLTRDTRDFTSEDGRSEYPEHVLKVYKADQTCKYLLIHKETSAHEVVMLSLQEFGITEPSTNFTLCEVSVAEGGFVKQRTLPDQIEATEYVEDLFEIKSRYGTPN